MPLADTEIIAAIAKDTEQGFRELVKTYSRPIYWHIRRLVVSHDDAQDATQETFIRIFRSLSQRRENASLKAWIFQIATHEALRLLEKRNGIETLSLDEAPEALPDSFADNLAQDADEITAELQRAILRLPPAQQLAFNLRYYDEMSYEDIAAVTGTNAAAAKANFHIAKKKIVQHMSDHCDAL
ncbi:MAG: RNA polymerase sigma factor [Alloprevotella sp.]